MGDALTYNWQAAGGLLSSNSKPKVIWTAPIEMGVTTVTLSVKDPTNKVVSKTAEVSVIHSLIVPGQEAAGIRLGTLLSDAAKLYGIPKHHFEPHPDGLEHFDVDHYEWKNDGIIVYLDSSDRIRRIDIKRAEHRKNRRLQRYRQLPGQGKGRIWAHSLSGGRRDGYSSYCKRTLGYGVLDIFPSISSSIAMPTTSLLRT